MHTAVSYQNEFFYQNESCLLALSLLHNSREDGGKLGSSHLNRKTLLSLYPTAISAFRPSITHLTPSVFHTDQRCENGAGVKRQIFEALQFPNKYENMFIIKSLIVIQKGAGPMGKYLLSQW